MQGIIYVVSNPAMPDLLKIGKTEREDVAARIGELYSTEVPLPFECEIAVKVEDVEACEKALHTAFGPQRINARREFFEIEPEQLRPLLLQLGEDVTPEVSSQVDLDDAASAEAAKQYKRSRRANLDFANMGISAGSILISVSGDETAEVLDNKRVKFRDQELFLTPATKLLLATSSNVRPTRHWTYEGQLLYDIWLESL